MRLSDGFSVCNSRASTASHRSFLESLTPPAHERFQLEASRPPCINLRQFNQLSFQQTPLLHHSLRMSAAPPFSTTPDPSPNMAEPSDKVTGFFSLPRELRDIIYDMAREEYSRAVNGVWFRYRAAIPTLRLVSRQLKLEYDQRPAVNTSVHVFDMLNRCTVEHFPRLAINSRYL
jgi:hypothetical protein